MMKRRLRRLLPSPEKLLQYRWLRWLGPVLHRPTLWHVSRRGVALGMALGVFFGLLIPLAQMPFAAAAAVMLRANVPVAVASTLVTNPVTFGPVYYAAWRLGESILGDAEVRETTPTAAVALPGSEGASPGLMQRVHRVGKPLVLGLAILATVAGLLTYALVSSLWYLKVILSRRMRCRARRAGSRMRA